MLEPSRQPVRTDSRPSTIYYAQCNLGSHTKFIHENGWRAICPKTKSPLSPEMHDLTTQVSARKCCQERIKTQSSVRQMTQHEQLGWEPYYSRTETGGGWTISYMYCTLPYKSFFRVNLIIPILQIKKKPFTAVK